MLDRMFSRRDNRDKLHFISYADSRFRKHQNIGARYARWLGRFDSIVAYGRGDIDKEFYEENKFILNAAKGGGYWLWKPYFILKRLREIEFGEYLLYSDAAAVIIRPISQLIDETKVLDQDVVGFELPLIEAQWTKMELASSLGCTEERFLSSNQIMSSFHLIRKSKESVEFYTRFLKLSCDYKLIGDDLNLSIQKDNFIEHRHDQSIFSLLYKMANYVPVDDITQFGLSPFLYSGCGGARNAEIDDTSLYVFQNRRQVRVNNLRRKLKVPYIILHRGSGLLRSIIKTFIFLVKDRIWICLK